MMQFKNYEIDIVGLTEFLFSLKLEDIEKQNTNNRLEDKLLNKTYKLIETNTIRDIDRFDFDKSKITLDRVVFYDEPFLVDKIGNDLSIVILTKRRYKDNFGNVGFCKLVTTVVNDCNKLYGTSLNGYWKIPEQFIIKY